VVVERVAVVEEMVETEAAERVAGLVHLRPTTLVERVAVVEVAVERAAVGRAAVERVAAERARFCCPSALASQPSSVVTRPPSPQPSAAPDSYAAARPK